MAQVRRIRYNSSMNTTTPSPENTLDASAVESAGLLDSLGESAADPEPNLPSNHHSTGPSSSVEEKAIRLLGAGIDAESVAAAVGVTPGRISQLLSGTVFAGRVTALRYESLQEHNVRDAKYDSLEDKLLKKLNTSMPLMYKPEVIMRAIQVVNGAKRRGQAAPSQDSVVNKNIITLVMPSIVTNKFVVDINNQVTKAGDQDLLTMPSGNLLAQVEEATERRLLESPTQPPIDTAPMYDTPDSDGDYNNEYQEKDEPRT